ncbi:methyltransferase domain-containing protein [Alginatibacterium sediminis]|uniref:Methyltransferase domain-containing protein n=1 Tax=Alginatibacterium sediminis TaxID=2164068 RepID=A0A420E9K1_9ALTE|nr:methyltransferase domain-containing protein [Alginatibacterium sediminis]RKF17376.1 methyltransferase domain-containing protein [Alginatibacterium sediminis]
MKPAKIKDLISVPDSWASISQGKNLAEQQQALLDAHLPRVFGYHLLKVGNLSCELSCHASMIRHQLNLAKNGQLVGLQAKPSELPLQESSIDCSVLLHVLDYSRDPHQVLREVERVLTADGYIIISGFNPMSLVGLRRYLPWPRKSSPWSARMFGPARVKDWLQLLGFEVLYDERFAFTSFVNQRPTPAWLENWGQNYARPFSSCYFMVARKRRSPLTPIRQSWRIKRRVSATATAS